MPLYKTGQTRDGKQGYRVRINYTDASGNYQTKTRIVYGLPEARFAEMEMLSQVGDAANAASMTVRELFDRYMSAKKQEVRQTTLDKTRHILENDVLPFFEKTRLDKLTVEKLQEWKNKVNERDISITTKKNIYREFRTMLNFAVRMEYTPKSPLDKLGNFKEVYFEKPQDKLHYYTPEQFKKYIAAAKETIKNPSDRACYVFFNVAYFTGMRKGEINALKWSDIDGNIIHVRRSVAQKIKGQPIVETPPKNKSSYRDIQIPNRLMAVLDEQRAYHKAIRKDISDLRVCGGENCISDTAIENHNKDYAKKADLPHIRIHDFRHSHASLLANEGINIQEIARRLGHSKIEMTWNTYSHLYPREEERAVKILDNI